MLRHSLPAVPCGSAVILLAVALVAGAAAESHGIEMFTFFGDGSRVGLPSLEVPVEAYPGIPLRSDRLRARRRGQRQASPPRQGQLPPGVTIRPLPAARPTPLPAARPVGGAPQAAAREGTGTGTTRRQMPVAPSPDDVLPPRGAVD